MSTEDNKPTCTECPGTRVLPAGGGLGIESERACPACVEPVAGEHDPATCPVKGCPECADCAACPACDGSGINPLGSTCVFCSGEASRRALIAKRLVRLADEMDSLAVDMGHFVGDEEAMHSMEIAGAGKIARQWADAWE